MNVVGLLNRREIEARLVAPLLESLSAEFGHERVWIIAQNIIHEIARQQGAQLANSIDTNNIENLAIALEAWKKDNAIQTEVIEQTDKKYAFNVFRCRFAEMYQHLGIPELGKMLSCDRDFAMLEGYNPKIRLTRTQTIMEGADICDFCYEMVAELPPR